MSQKPAPWDENPDAPILSVGRVVYWKSIYDGYYRMQPAAHWAPPARFTGLDQADVEAGLRLHNPRAWLDSLPPPKPGTLVWYGCKFHCRTPFCDHPQPAPPWTLSRVNWEPA